MSIESVLDYPLPSSEAEREELKNYITNMRNANARIESENEFIKETSKEASEKFQIPAATLRQLAKDLAKDTFKKRTDKQEAYNELYQGFTSVILKQKE